MKRRVVGICFFLLSFLFFSQLVSSSEVRAQGSAEQEIVRIVNELRARHGLPPFIWDQRLATAAQNQANYMATNNVYSHTGAGGSSPQSRAQAAGFPGRATENIVGGTSLTPGQGVIWWQNSPTHFNTLIAPRYTHVGVGFASGFDQNFYTLVAGAPSAVVASSSAQPAQANDHLLAPVTPIELAIPREDGAIIHVVGSGQSFWAIAARYEVPLEQLYLYNNMEENSVINPGDEITIRLADGQEPPPTPTPPANFTVREGDSWWTIAAWHRLSVEDLLWLNSASEESLLQPGDKVRIRLLPDETPPPTATPQLTHIVRAGETAWDISLLYDLSLDEFLTLNELGPNPVLSIGDELIIVTPSPSPSATAPPTETLIPTSFPTQAPTETLPSSHTLDEPEKIAEPTVTIANPESRIFSVDRELTGLYIGIILLAFGVLAIIFVRRNTL